MTKLTNADRNKAIGMIMAGMSSTDVSRRFRVSERSVRRLVIRYSLTGVVDDRRRTGRPRKTTAAEDRNIRIMHLRRREKTASETSRDWTGAENISRQTVVRRLRERNIRCRRPVKKFGLTDRHRRTRLGWATAHRRWTLRQWEGVIFSDEKVFQLAGHNGQLRVYRRPNERFSTACIPQVGDRCGVMVWGAISAAGKSQLIRLHGNINADQYQEQALANGLIPFLNNHNGNMHFMHDGAKPHTARTTTAWLAAHRVQVFGPWPSKSPDMNPIENCWGELSRRVRVRMQQQGMPHNADDLFDLVQDEWVNLDQAYVRRLVLSMRRRCVALFDADGGHTKY